MLPCGNTSPFCGLPFYILLFFSSGGLTLEEALQIAYNDDLDVDQIYIEPPNEGAMTDEDSGEEDEGGLVDNLSRNQLNAPAQLVLHGEDDALVEPDTEHVEKVTYEDIEWIKGDLVESSENYFRSDYESFKTLTPTEMFELFIDQDVLSLLVEESNKYAQFKNLPCPQITLNEMKCFIAILILSGYCQLPGKKHYWSTDADLGNQLVKDSMRRDRFLTIWRYLHCADNNALDPNDKFYKLRPLSDLLRQKFLNYFVPEEDLNYDECMVKYFGKHSCKQFIRGKPIRFGYKIWSLNNKYGYLVNFSFYQGKDRRVNTEYQTVFGKSTAPLLMLLDELPEEKKKHRYNLFIDNLFTSFHLLSHLKSRGFSSTGTIRDNRIPKNCPLLSKKDMSKKQRGDFDSCLDRTNGILLTRWTDNNVVSAASIKYGVAPLASVQRYSAKEKKIVQVKRPNLISKYNASMGGTDLMDENIARYRISLRGKKWWWCLFTWLLDAAIQNAWVLYKQSGNKITQLDFRREIVKTYLNKYKNPPKGKGRPSASKSSRSFSRVGDDVRYDNIGHLLTPVEKKIRCNGDNCKSIMRTKCIKCNVGVCLSCNVEYHTRM